MAQTDFLAETCDKAFSFTEAARRIAHELSRDKVLSPGVAASLECAGALIQRALVLMVEDIR